MSAPQGAEGCPGDDDTPLEAEVRAAVRPWMEAHAAKFGPAQRHRKMQDTEGHVAAGRAWQAELDEGGWGAVSWPIELGGRGYGPVESRVFYEEQGRFAVPTGSFHIAIGMVAPTLFAHGSDEQRDRFLEPMRRGEHVWCQLFSEPDAGSDLASLRTRAVRDGDEWVLSGQKVWTSGARYADWAICLARTDPSSRRHDGITYFLVDMRAPGVEVRPLVQINRTAHFNEVFLHDVRVPAHDVVGGIGDGWRVTRTTLGVERTMIGSLSMHDRAEALISHLRHTDRLDDVVLRDAVVRAWVRSSVLTFTGDRMLSAVRHGGEIGPEASVLKLGLSVLMEEVGNLAMHVLGADGLLEGGGDGDAYGALQDQFLGQWASRIGGGTEQIQRNLIGERALGLPREPA